MCHMSTHVFFLFFLILFFYNLKNKIVTCQADIVPRGKDSVIWQWQCHMLLLNVKSLNIVFIFVILSQFDPNFLKTELISSLYQI